MAPWTLAVAPHPLLPWLGDTGRLSSSTPHEASRRGVGHQLLDRDSINLRKIGHIERVDRALAVLGFGDEALRFPQSPGDLCLGQAGLTPDPLEAFEEGLVPWCLEYQYNLQRRSTGESSR